MNPVDAAGARVKSGCCAVLVAVAAVVRAQLGEYTEAGGDLEVTIPGVPGEDYPIYPAVPDTGFACDGLVEGGQYCCSFLHLIQPSVTTPLVVQVTTPTPRPSARPSTSAVRIPLQQTSQTYYFSAANDGAGGLLTYSVLCPNGTIFNQGL